MSEPRTLSLLPWQVTLTEFTAKAGKGGSDAACVAFVVDPSIPQIARGGYASLVMAYSRADEPVCVLDDGAALVWSSKAASPRGRRSPSGSSCRCAALPSI